MHLFPFPRASRSHVALYPNWEMKGGRHHFRVGALPRVALPPRQDVGGAKEGGGTASGFAPAPFASPLCAREDGRAHPHSRAGPRSAICTHTGARGGAPLLCPRMVPPSPPGLRATLALRFATLTIRSASRFYVKGVRTPFPFTRTPSPASATPVPARLHVADREHTEKKGGRGYTGKPRSCGSKGRGRRLTNRMGARTRQGRAATGQNAVCAPPYFVPPVRTPVCAQRRGGHERKP